jgi:hypothetical protein
MPQLPAGYPAYPPTWLLLMMFLIELGFGFAYNWFYRWVGMHVALAVVIGVFLTFAITYPFMFWVTLKGEQWLVIMLIAFAGSGTPMALLSIQDTKTESKKRRPMPNWVIHNHMDAAYKLTNTIQRVETAAEEKAIDAGFLLKLTNDLHEIKGILKV